MSDADELSPTSPAASASASTPESPAGSKPKAKRPTKDDPGAQLRRDQNRVAQREFRLRKQQHIRDLEARIEILSGNREEHQELMALLVRNLLAENAQLRKMIKGMAGFVGEGLATSLPRIGLTPQSLEAFLSRPETETAHEAYAALKEARRREEAGELKLGSGEGLGRGLDKEPLVAGSKRKWASTSGSGSGSIDGVGAGGDAGKKRRGSGMMEVDAGGLTTADLERANPQQPTYWSALPSSGGGSSSFSTFMQSSTIPLPIGGNPASALHRELMAGSGGMGPGDGDGDGDGDEDGLLDPTMFVGMGLFPSKTPPQQIRAAPIAPPAMVPVSEAMGFVDPETAKAREKAEATMELFKVVVESAVGRRKEAMQLITYHLENYRNDPDYHLPPSLVPTEVQRMIDHEHIIDGILNPKLRDMMIFLRGKFDILEVWKDWLQCFEIRGDDTLDHNSWEVPEHWLRKHAVFVDKTLLAICNKWRVGRGEPELILEELKAGVKK